MDADLEAAGVLSAATTRGNELLRRFRCSSIDDVLDVLMAGTEASIQALTTLDPCANVSVVIARLEDASQKIAEVVVIRHALDQTIARHPKKASARQRDEAIRRIEQAQAEAKSIERDEDDDQEDTR